MFALAAPVAAQALVPAGTINAAAGARPALLLAHDDPAVLRSVTALRDKLFAGCEIVTGAPKDEQLAGKALLVWATPEHPLLRAHEKALPFRFDGRRVQIDGRTFEGDHLRVIAAMRNPADAACTMLVYCAARAQDLADINSVFHGPTEWVVADGRKVLGSGSFLSVSLTPGVMRSDLEQLVATIEEVHPSAVDALPADVAAAAKAARAATLEPLGRAAFSRQVAAVLLALHDAHSAVAVPRSGASLALPLVWLPEGLVVAADCGELRAGDRLVTLSGRTPEQLDALLATVVPSENEHWRRYQGPGLLADLGALSALGLAAEAPVKVRVDREGKPRDVDVPAGPVPAGARPAKWARYEIDEKRSLGVFTFDRCVVDATYRDTLDAFFREVHEKKVKRVAVDLRANTGGNSQVTNEFLRYLDRAEFKDFSGDVRWSKPALEQRKGSGEPRFEPAKPQRRRNDRHSEPPPFQGELFVLIGPATFSSGNWFATVMSDNGFARLLGEPTGNAPSSYGDILTFTLPASGLSYTLSFKRWRRPDGARDPAPTLLPDVPLPRTAATVREGSDPVLDWLRAQ